MDHLQEIHRKLIVVPVVVQMVHLQLVVLDFLAVINHHHHQQQQQQQQHLSIIHRKVAVVVVNQSYHHQQISNIHYMLVSIRILVNLLVCQKIGMLC